MKSLEELKAIRERVKKESGLKEKGTQTQLVVGMGTCGIAAGARTVLLTIMDELANKGLEDVSVTQTGCMGMCEKEPLLEVKTLGGTNTLYAYVNAERARRIIANHVINGEPVAEWIINRG